MEQDIATLESERTVPDWLYAFVSLAVVLVLGALMLLLADPEAVGGWLGRVAGQLKRRLSGR